MSDDETQQAQNDPDFRAGYEEMWALHRRAERRGWRVPLRILAREMLRLEHSAAPPTGGRALPMLEEAPYPPNWYRGRAAALREILSALRAAGQRG